MSMLARNFPNRAMAPMTFDHKPWQDMLSRYIRTTPEGINLFAYADVTTADRKRLKDYLYSLQQAPVSALSRNAQMAFWINLYNAKTIDVVLDHYPLRSIREIKADQATDTAGPWHLQDLVVEGRPLSLNNIEHDILRRKWRDPRVHYAVNCASSSCPNLAAAPFTEENLDAMLDAGARSYINRSRGVTVEGDRLVLSQIFEWYRRDFGGTDAQIVSHISTFADETLKSKLEAIRSIGNYDYDWSLNEAK